MDGEGGRTGFRPRYCARGLFVTANVVEKSLVVTDGHPSYKGVPSWKYTHKVEKTSVLDGEEILPNVHRVAALLKRWLIGTHQHFCLNGHLQAYLDEFVFRFNRRNSRSRGPLFDTLIKQAIHTKPTPIQADDQCVVVMAYYLS